MNAQRHQRVMEILGEAIELSPAEREAWLSNACAGDTDLRSEVMRLLSHQKTVTDFMEESPFDLMRLRSVDESIIGHQIGPYKIIEEIGRGGMGAVFMASRADKQYESSVAIKVIKRGMDTDYILRSFRNERQILAYLDHPHIAKLLDGGTTEDGRSYFIMEYIKGQNLRKYCDDRKLSIDERLRLFLKICSAVSYAHQNLIVHRDLKPSNILVTAAGVPKLLDFGIAKILSPDKMEETSTNALAMTPEYASPEQLQGQPITTASDIYSLGVTLYELLTGHRPYNFEGRTQAEVAQIINGREPEKPSTALTHVREVTSTDGAQRRRRTETDEISLARASSLAELRRKLRGDLDNIVLMAMRKEPQRRYASVEQLSEDIKRHLEGLPVRARKDTFRYRALKLIQRNKVSVAAAALILITLIGGIIATTWEAHVARRERAIAEERFKEVRQMAHAVMFDYHDAIATLPGSTPVRERMVKDSLNYLNTLAQQAGNDRDLLREIASAYLKIGDVQGRPLYPNLGDIKGAMESYRKSLSIRQGLSALDPANAGLQEELAGSYDRVGELNQVIGDPATAVENMRKSIAIYEKLLSADQSNKKLRSELAWAYSRMGMALGLSAIANLGDAKGSMDYHRKSLAIYEALAAEEPANLTYREGVGFEYPLIAQLLSDNGNQTEALDNYRKALSIHQSLAHDDPTNNFHQRELAVNYSNLCGVMMLTGDKAGAVESCRRALPIFESLASADPNDNNITIDVAIIHRKLGEALGKANDRAGALEQFQAALRIFHELSADDSTNAYRLRHQGLVYLKFSEFLSDTGNVAAATESARRAREIYESLVSANAKNALAAKELALVYSQLGKCHTLLAVASGTPSNQRINHWREARDFYQKSMELYQDMKSKGTLSGADGGKPDEVASEIAKCDAALSRSN